MSYTNRRTWYVCEGVRGSNCNTRAYGRCDTCDTDVCSRHRKPHDEIHAQQQAVVTARLESWGNHI